MAIGGGEWWGDSDDEKSIETIRKAVEAGITLIDTAPCYGFGKSETVVGKALKGIRDKVILSTKCGLWWNDERGSFFFAQDGHNVNRCLEPDTIKREVKMSLKRLDTDYLDIYFTHWQVRSAVCYSHQQDDGVPYGLEASGYHQMHRRVKR